MMDLLPSRRKFLLGPAVDDSDIPAETQSCPGSIHGHISAADDHDFPRVHHRCKIIVPVGIHQVVPCQKFICREHPVQIFSRNVHEPWQAGTGTDENRTETFLAKQGIYRHCPSDHHICLYLHPESLHIGYFSGHDLLLRKPEFRDSVFEDPARFVERLEDGDIISGLRQVVRAGKTGRAAAYHCHLEAVGRSLRHTSSATRPRPVRHEPLEFTYGHRLPFHAEDTAALALGLLGTYPSAYCRQ